MAENDKSLFNVSDRSDPTPAAVDMSELERAFQSPQAQNPDLGTPEFVTPAETRSVAGEFIGGLKAGWSQVGTDLRATAAMGLAISGYEKDAIELMNIVMARQDQDEKDFPKSISRIEDVDSISDFAKWAARSLGEQIPVVASLLIGGGGASMLGRLAGKGALSLGAAPQLVARFPTIFTGIGVAGTTIGMETGSTAAELFQATGELQPEASFIAGITKGALESITPLMLGGRLGLTPDLSRLLSARTMANFERLLPGRIGSAVRIGGTEMVTETLQEAVDIAARSIVDESYDWLSEETRSRLLNAAAGGLFVGSVFGLASRGNRRQTGMEEGTPVMPPEFGLTSPDVSLGEDATGLPGGPTLKIGQEPGTMPGLNIPVQASIPQLRAAIQVGNQVFTGANHIEALEVVRQRLGDNIDFTNTREGFVTADGKFLSRDEATQLAGKTGQSPLYSEDIPVQGTAYDPNLPPGLNNRVPDYRPLEGFPKHARQINENFASYDPTLADNDFFQLAQYPERITTLDGKGYNHDVDAKPGKATFIFDKQDPRRAKYTKLFKHAESFANRVLKEFGLQDKLVLFPGKILQDNKTMSNLFNVAGYGHFGGFADGTSVIGVNPETSQQEALWDNARQNFFAALAHELGHLIVARKYANASPELKARIQREYEEALTRVAYGDMRYSGSFLNFSYMELFGWTDKTKGAGAIAANPFYRFSADEWIAENIARYLTEDLMKPARFAWSETAKWFQGLAADLRKLYYMAKEYLGIEVAPSLREWLDSIRSRKGFEFSKIATAMEAKDKQANEAVLKPVSNAEFIPPPQPASAGMGRLLDKLGIPKLKSREIRAFADKFSWFMDLFMNIQQIGQHNPHIKPVQRYLELVDQWYNFQMNWMGRADERLREWKSLGKEQSRRLSQMLFAVDAMEYLTPEERKAGTLRQPTPAELAGLKSKYGLNDAAFQQFIKVREDFAAVLDQIEQTSLRDINRALSDGPAKQQAINELTREMAALRSRPYFPHARFGDWSVVIKDKKGGKTVFMQQFQSERAAAQALPELLAIAKRDYPNAIARPDYIPREVHGFRGLPPNLIAKIKQHLKLSDTQNQWLDNLIIEMAPSASFRHHLQKRMNTPGFSLDAQRAYASYFFHGARHLARIEYGPQLQEEVTAGMNQSITDLEGTPEVSNAPTRRRIQEYMANHLEHILNPKPDWAQLRSAAFLWYLGFNVSSAALNVTQPIMVGTPYLAARFGDVKAIGAMMKAVRDIQNVYKFREPDRVSDALLKALNRAMHEGVVEESQAAELAASAQGGYLAKLLPGTKLQRFAQMMSHYGGWMFQQTERLNRRIMFRAAWELAMKNPNSKYLSDLVSTNMIAMNDMLAQGFDQLEARAYLAAKDAVHQTQFRYGQHARPKFMRGKKGVVFTFFMFTQSMLHFVRYSPGNTRYMVMMLFMAGLMGLPGAEDLEAIAKLLARNLLGKEFDLQREVRELVTGMLGDEVPPDLFLHGAGRVGFGMPALMDLLGLPKAQFDFSRRIGFGRIVPGLAELGAPGTDFDEAMSRVGQQAAGATFGIGFNIIRALADDQLPVSDFKRWERMMPASLSNLSKVLRYAQEGRERSRTDATIVDYNVTDPDHLAELALRAIGFQPTRVAREWDRIKMQREAEAYWMGRRAIIMKLWSHSFGVGDADMRERALDDVRSYNAEVPFGSMKISGEQLAKSRKEHLRQIRLREAGLTNSKAMRPLAREIESLHPETLTSEIVDVSVVR